MSEQSLASQSGASEASLPTAPTAAEILATAEVAAAAQSLESQPEIQPEAQPGQGVEAKPAAEVDKKFAQQFAALARKEKQLRQQERAMAQKIAEYEKKLAENESIYSPYKKLKETIESKQNPLEALANVGLDYKKLTDEYVIRGEPTEEDKLQSYVKSLESKLSEIESKLTKQDEDSKKLQEEAKKKQQEVARKNYLEHLNSFVEKNADKYELIKSNDAAELIYQVMEEHYNKTEQETGEPEVLSEEQAADMVEAHLLDQAKKLVEAKKIKSLLGAQTKPTEQSKPPVGKSATLSNDMSQQVPTSKNDKFLSDDESKRLIASMIKFNS